METRKELPAASVASGFELRPSSQVHIFRVRVGTVRVGKLGKSGFELRSYWGVSTALGLPFHPTTPPLLESPHVLSAYVALYLI